VAKKGDWDLIVASDSKTNLKNKSVLRVEHLRSIPISWLKKQIGFLPLVVQVELGKVLSSLLPQLNECGFDSKNSNCRFQHGSCHEVAINGINSVREKVVIVSCNDFNQRSDVVLVVPIHLPELIYCVDKRFFVNHSKMSLDFNLIKANEFLHKMVTVV